MPIDPAQGRLALSIRQPFAELILRGIKTVEYRTRATRIVGQRFWIYASRQRAVGGRQKGIWSGDLSSGGDLPAWMIELAEQVRMIQPGTILPRGVIVGSAVIERCVVVEGTEGRRGEGTKGLVAAEGTEGRRGEAGSSRERNPFVPTCLRAFVPSPCLYAWHLSGVRRIGKLRRPIGRPQPVWFHPF